MARLKVGACPRVWPVLRLAGVGVGGGREEKGEWRGEREVRGEGRGERGGQKWSGQRECRRVRVSLKPLLILAMNTAT